MTEERALSLLREKAPEGLAWFIRRYTPYVGTVIWNIIGRVMTAQDAEELCSDVFIALWQNHNKPNPGRVRAYLGSIARHKAYSLLRKNSIVLAIEDDIMTLPGSDPEDILSEQENSRILRQAVEDMPPPDREIFVRYYYYCQTAKTIARETRMSPAAVRQRLKRGRDRLRERFAKEGLLDEASYF